MSDVDVVTDSPDTAVVANIQSIPITKVKGAALDIDFDALPIEVYKEMLYLGAKEYINSVKMSKIGAGLTKLEGAELEKAKTAVVTQAKANAEAMATGKDFKFHGASKSDAKVSGAVQTEAMRLAKNLVKDAMKKAGLKISHTPASEITAAAKVVLTQMPDLYKTAEANLAQRAETPIKGIDIKALVKADPELVAKAEASKAAKKKGAPLSAKQSGMVAPRQKPKGGAQVTAH
jgi:hypothetical protein